MLETNPALLTEAEARFLAMFGPGRAPERERVPIQAAHARASASALAAAPAGWYDDTRGSLRWWNGLAWSEHVRTGQGNAAVRTPSAASPGWYADGTGWLRWWDGWQWTGHVAPVEVARSR